MTSKLTNQDREMLEIFSDPAKWAEHHLGEKPRWYQERILRHPHHRKVLRCGRRIGKCIGENERILNPSTGEYASVGELYKRYEAGESAGLATLDKHYKIQPSEAFQIEKNGEKPVFTVETKMGAQVELTGNHPVLTLDGWVEVDALSVGMRIATPSALPYFGDDDISMDRLRLIAYMITGGHWNGERMTFSCKSEDRMLDFAKTAAALGIQTFKQADRKNTRVVMSKLDTELRHAIIDKRIPKEVFTLKPKLIARFLNFMYQISGWVHSTGRPELGISSTSKQLMTDTKHLLLRFGISANLQTRKKGPYVFYQMLIHRKSTAQHFLDVVGVFGDKATTADFARKMDALEPVEHSIPLEIWPHIEKLRKAKDMPKAKLAGGHDKRLKMDRAPGMSRVAHFAEMLQDEFLYDLAHSDVLWEEVVAIDNAGMRETYDVFVPETHNLIVEDVMVHNTWTMTAHMLWVAFTCNGGTELKKGATCLVATPYDSQAREIFDQLNNFINSNPILEDSVERIIRSPYEITFKNGSRIKLYTAGSKNGTEGGSLRGQKASWLYLDEVDYLGDKDFEAIFAITFEAPERIGVMVASTPTGRRGKFYQICHQPLNQDVKVDDKTHKFDINTYDRSTAEGWQEFHYSTSVNPEWSERMEREMRGIYTDVAYEHEVLAEFGSEMAGVFNKEYIDEASASGYALLSRPRIDAPIAIGIDWDKYGSATQIVVTQWNPLLERRPDNVGEEGQALYGRLQVINRVEIPQNEFTYDNAVRKIIELDKIYNPFAIYPDRGSGEYQIEILRKALGDKVKGIHLGSSYEVRDPHSREYSKKPIKPFIVNQTTMLLERGQLMIPSKDVDEVLQRQMTNYRVERIAPKTGEPTYSSEDEHALDGLMLGVFAFIEHHPELIQTVEQVKMASRVAFSQVKFVDPIGRIYQEQPKQDRELQNYIDKWDEPTAPPPRKVSGRRKTADFTWGSRGSSRQRGLPKRRRW